MRPAPTPEERIAQLEREVLGLRSAIGLLHRIANLVRATLELEATLYSVLTGVTAGVGLGMNRAVLFLADPKNRRVLRGAAAVGPADAEEADRVWREIVAEAPDLETLHEIGMSRQESRGRLDAVVRNLVVPIDGQSPVALAMRSGRVIQRQGSDDLGGLLHLPTCIAAPLRGRRTLHGVLYADNCFTAKRGDAVIELVFGMVADLAGRAIESAREYERVAGEARTDALTGLGHHGSLMADLDAAALAAKANGESLGLAMIDLDGFKSVNDTHGHLAGDAFLVEVAARLRSVVREGETLYRYGGDEFAVLLHGASPEGAARVGERLRLALAGKTIVVNQTDEVKVTCSVGTASLPADATDANGLVAAADSALLAAKRAGKNSVIPAVRIDRSP